MSWVLVNLVHTCNIKEKYLYDPDPWMGILAAAAFAVHFTYYCVKGKIPGHIVFEWDMVLPIVTVSNWRYIRQHKQ